MGKSWEEKMRRGSEPVVKTVDKRFADIPEGASMLIATPEIVADYIAQIPFGHSTELPTIRRDLAEQFNADKACPVTTGIFLRIVSERAYEQIQEGTPVEEVTPFWRVIGPKSKALKKLTFDPSFVLDMRVKEGID